MTKQQFIQELSESLLNEVDSQEYHNSIQYYTKYIEDEVKRGKTEEEVTTALGNPRLIAKTIIDAQLVNGYKNHVNYENISGYENTEQSIPNSGNHQEEDWRVRINGRSISKWYEKLGLVLIAIVAVMVVLGILGVAFTLIWHVVLPILIIIAIFKLINNFFRK